MRQPDPTAATAADPIEDLGQGGLLGQATELGLQILLERLAPLLRSTLQLGVHGLGQVSYEDVRHAYSMQALVGHCKSGTYVGTIGLWP